MGINGTDSMSRLRHKPFLALSLIAACVMNMAEAQETKPMASQQRPRLRLGSSTSGPG